MAVIDMHHTHKITLKAAKAAVEKVAEAIAGEYGVAHHWSGDELHFDRSGVKGRIAVTKSDVHVHIELGFLMNALKPRIEREIERRLDQYIV